MNEDDEDYKNSLQVDTSEDLKEHIERRKAKTGHSPVQTQVTIQVRVLNEEGTVTDYIETKRWVPADKQDELNHGLVIGIDEAISNLYP